MNKIYMDYASTTYVKEEVLNEMLPFFSEKFGNPSSFYNIARDTKMAIDKARGRISKVLNCSINELYFTSSGSESDNWAIKGVMYSNKDKGNHIITTKIEHHAVLKTCEYLEKQGYEVTYLNVDKDGMVDLEELKNSIKKNTVLVSIMAANNEIGTIQPIKEIGAICRERNVYFHTDAVQAFGSINLDVQDMNIDLLSISAHKIYGPKGIGALYIKQGIKIDNLIHGGGQERARRAGTENVPFIAGFGKATEIAYENIEENNKKLIYLRDRLIKGILEIEGATLNGSRENRLPNNANFSFDGVNGEDLLLSLDFKGICASSGSACTSGSLKPSHVLLALGVDEKLAKGSLRLTLGSLSTEEEVDFIIETLKPTIFKLSKKK